MQSKSSDNLNAENEIYLRDVVLGIKAYIDELLKYWWIIAIAVLLCCSWFVYDAFVTPPEYHVNLTFMVNEDKDGGIGGVAGILSTIGLKKGGNSEYNLEKILKLSKTKIIIREALFAEKNINNNNDFLANHFIKIYDYHTKWENDTTGLKDFLFVHNDFDRFSRVENKVLKLLHVLVIGNAKAGVEGLMTSGLDEDSGIMSLSLFSEQEDFSISMVNSIFEKLGDFYVKKSTEKQQTTFDLVKSKTDSIYGELMKSEYELADFRDSNRGLYSSKDELKKLRLTRKVQMLKLMYGESLKNQEISDFSLKNKRPFIQEIDVPVPPVTPAVKSKILAIIIGCVVGGFLSGAFIVIRKFFRDVMADPAV